MPVVVIPAMNIFKVRQNIHARNKADMRVAALRLGLAVRVRAGGASAGLGRGDFVPARLGAAGAGLAAGAVVGPRADAVDGADMRVAALRLGLAVLFRAGGASAGLGR